MTKTVTHLQVHKVARQLRTADPSELQEGRVGVATECNMIFALYRPGGWKVEHRSSLKGKLDDFNPVMYVPEPKTRKALYVGLYMSALVHLREKVDFRHLSREAKKWTRDTMQRHGIPVPRDMLEMNHMNRKLWPVRKPK